MTDDRNLNFFEFLRERLEEAENRALDVSDLAMSEVEIWQDMLRQYEAIHRERADLPHFKADRRMFELDAALLTLARPLHQYAALHREHPDWSDIWEPDVAAPLRRQL